MTTPSAARHIVNFITGNANKLGEVKAILEPAIQVESQTLDLIEIQGTLEEVTLDKCRRAADLVRIRFLDQEDFQLTPKQGRRPRPSRRHLPLLQRAERPAGAVHVRLVSRHPF
jgi:inosine triphosphate pyrophosphatase